MRSAGQCYHTVRVQCDNTCTRCLRWPAEFATRSSCSSLPCKIRKKRANMRRYLARAQNSAPPKRMAVLQSGNPNVVWSLLSDFLISHCPSEPVRPIRRVGTIASAGRQTQSLWCICRHPVKQCWNEPRTRFQLLRKHCAPRCQVAIGPVFGRLVCHIVRDVIGDVGRRRGESTPQSHCCCASTATIR